jgi:hypothetical protein
MITYRGIDDQTMFLTGGFYAISVLGTIGLFIATLTAIE